MGGGLCTYVRLSPRTQQLEARMLREGSTSLRGEQQVDEKACGSVFVLYICLCVCVCWLKGMCVCVCVCVCV